MTHKAFVSASSQQLRRWGRRVFDTFFSACDPLVAGFGKENVWHIQADLLGAGSIVLSAGVGGDISFEKELVSKLGCRVVLLDPSPTGTATMARPENQVPGIEFLPVGLAGSDGEQDFLEPMDAREGSYRTASVATTGSQATRFRCRSVSSLARERGWSRLDLVKLDIEGFEYEVIADMLTSGVRVEQLCVEFHHFMDGIPLARTWRALFALHRAGFRFSDKHGSDYTLIRAD